ncbi:peroxide stress protein YaaA [Agromyces archimandritae]|uniref:Peroxide stress protein YaaA n=1 Tax=Agromyces archimandritae TaxID=2781962 RepID=A0A975IPZ6_9MICO|nr:peroxide stress protein YaaA [Agromyces archimandritae]
MRIILPPSETKRSGGDGPPLAAGSLAFPELDAARRPLLDAVVRLAGDREASIHALKLGPKQHDEVDRNLTLLESPTMPVIDRFTGVLYEGLDAGTLSETAREFAREHLLVHSALFGILGGLDRVPAYRLSHDSRVPGFVLKRHWAPQLAAVLEAESGLLLDLRSEAYAALGPAPVRPDSVYLRVLTEGPGGVRRALNHFNKQAKGRFARALLEQGEAFGDVSALLAWAEAAGWRLETLPERPGELALIV